MSNWLLGAACLVASLLVHSAQWVKIHRQGVRIQQCEERFATATVPWSASFARGLEDAARARSSERGSGDPAARDHARNDTSELESVRTRLELCEAERRGSRTRATAPETDSAA